MMNVYEEDFRVRCMEVNRKGRLKLESFFDYFQEVASVHAEKLGCGFRVLSAKGQAWVLSKIRLDVNRVPSYGDELRVRTWPSGFKRLYALRQAQFGDSSGEIATLTSYWVLLDLGTMRPLRLPEALELPLPDNDELPRYFEVGSRTRQEGALEHPEYMTVPEHFIDMNAHTNNARYCSLVGDWLFDRTGETVDIASITAHFLQATPVGTKLAVQGRLEDDGAFYVEIADGGENPVLRFAAEGRIRKE